MKIPEVGA